jgi:hypothetical protein
MIERRNFVIIAHHFSIPVKIQNPGPAFVSFIKSGRDRNIRGNGDEKIIGPLRTRAEVPARIE